MRQRDVNQLKMTKEILSDLQKEGFSRGILAGYLPGSGTIVQILARDGPGTITDLVTGKVIPKELYRFETDDIEKAIAWRKKVLTLVILK